MGILETALLLAMREAKKSPSNFRHGAVILSKSEILNSGYNRPFSLVKDMRKKAHLHAEISATFGVHSKRFPKSEILVIRIDQQNQLTESRPCKKCLNILKRKGVKKVTFSNKVGKLQKMSI